MTQNTISAGATYKGWVTTPDATCPSGKRNLLQASVCVCAFVCRCCLPASLRRRGVHTRWIPLPWHVASVRGSWWREPPPPPVPNLPPPTLGPLLRLQMYTGGTYASGCSTLLSGQLRASNVTYACHPDGQTIALDQTVVETPGACMYPFTVFVPCGSGVSALCTDVTPTPSVTALATSTASASHTTSASASISAGASPSNSPSNSASPSGTVAASGAPTGPATPSATPWSSLPNRIRVLTSTATALNFVELLAFSPTGKLLTATATGATVYASSVFGTQVAAYGADLCADPYDGPACVIYSSVGTTSTGDYWEVTFPGGVASAVATVYFVNRMDGGFNTRITSGAGKLALFSPNGNMAFVNILSAATVSM